MPPKEHIHRLKRKVYSSGSKVYFCTLPDCYFKIDVGLALGKKNICNRCGEVFVLHQYALRLARPHCEKCHSSRETNAFKLKPGQPSIPSRNAGNLEDRRELPTRREYDPTVLPAVADSTLSSLKSKLSGGITYQEIPDLEVDLELSDNEDDML